MGPLFLVEMPGSDPVTNFDVVFLVFFFFPPTSCAGSVVGVV